MEIPAFIAKRLEVNVTSLEEGAKQIKELEDQVGVILSSIRQRQIDLCLTRFKEGAIVHSLIESSDKGATEVVFDLCDKVGIGNTILWDSRRLFLREEWGQSLELFKAWLLESEDKPTWSYLRNWLNKQQKIYNPGYLSSRIERYERKLMNLEKEGDELEEDLNKYAKGRDLIEGKGVVAKMEQMVQDGQLQRAKDILGKARKPARDRKYLDYIRTLPCCVSGLKANIHAHHIKGHGTGVKGSDYGAIPLTSTLHHELHAIGKDSFSQKYRVNLWEEVAQCLAIYFTGRPIK